MTFRALHTALIGAGRRKVKGKRWLRLWRHRRDKLNFYPAIGRTGGEREWGQVEVWNTAVELIVSVLRVRRTEGRKWSAANQGFRLQHSTGMTAEEAFSAIAGVERGSLEVAVT